MQPIPLPLLNRSSRVSRHEFEGEAYITGKSTHLIDDAAPYAKGFSAYRRGLGRKTRLSDQ